MSLINSLSKPYFEPLNESEISSYSSVLGMLDEILMSFSTLIADVEEGRVSEQLLRMEIEKKVDQMKGIYQPDEVKRLLFDTIYGYGIIQDLINDAEISDIDIPKYNFIMIKRNGHLEKSKTKFNSEADFDRFCKLLAIRHGGILNEVDDHCRISDKTNHLRINICVPPRNVEGASLNIRKHQVCALTFEDLIEKKFMCEEVSCLINKINQEKSNILICGKGAAGKTTLLRSMIDVGDEMERMLICESDAEIYPQKDNVIVQNIKKREYGGRNITLSDLIREGLTMSLDTYCIGEIVGNEAWEFVKAGYTDHRVIGTIHSSSAIDALDRILMLSENETRITQDKLLNMIARAVNHIIYLKNFRVEEIIEVKGYDLQSASFQVEYLYG